MTKIRVDVGHQSHIVDSCSTCGLTWFNSREFESIPRRMDTLNLFNLPEDLRQEVQEMEIRDGKAVAARSNFRLMAEDFGWGWDRTTEGRIGGFRLLIALLLNPIERGQRRKQRVLSALGALGFITFVSLLAWFWPAADLTERFALNGGLRLFYEYIFFDDRGFGSLSLNLFAYGLIHGSVMHLLGNLYYFWFFGSNVEDEYGPGVFWLVVLLGTAGAGLAHLISEGFSGPGLVGISGGVSALGMAYTMAMPRAKIAFFLLIGWLRLPAYALTGVWVVMQLLLAKDQVEGLTNVSAMAHLGGAAVGLAIYWTVLRPKSNRSA
jgi:membrane associated rhomboid family serine protease